MNKTKPKPRHRAHVASLIPGRLRIKLNPRNRDAMTLHGIQADLQSHEGVSDVKVNPANGSLTMNFDKGHYSAKGIMGLLEDVDVLVESVGHLPGWKTEATTTALASSGFLAAVEDLNRRIQSATGLPIDLKLVLPLSFVSAGLWSVAKRGLMIETVPGWLFLWFAFDMFVKLHPVRQGKDEPIGLEWE
jgi:hypothetical protein